VETQAVLSLYIVEIHTTVSNIKILVVAQQKTCNVNLFRREALERTSVFTQVTDIFVRFKQNLDIRNRIS
jgi:hypothetical protein